MGKPRMIILIRHAQSEGNLNRDVHQIIPDHRVKLTAEGRQQAEDAGLKLRHMLRRDDTIRVYTSPYRRTRETAEGLLTSLTKSNEYLGPSPFRRENIIVREEPRLREQDFGNFQPCSAEMERMWQERADYGHFFYRIPNGESAADAYDRISGFNDSLWRSFSEDDFPSVLILVTHGLMTRVFLMRWFHYTVETFEDLRNINHCEFVIMNRNSETDKYVLQNKLRTWSELKRKATLANTGRRPSSSIQPPPQRQWGGCVDGCNHRDHKTYRRRRTITENRALDAAQSANATNGLLDRPKMPEEPARSTDDIANIPSVEVGSSPPSLRTSQTVIHLSSQNTSSPPASSLFPPASPFGPPSPLAAQMRGRDAGGSLSGMPTPTSERSPTRVSDLDPPSKSAAPKVETKATSPGYFPAHAVDRELSRLSIDARLHSQTRKRRDRPARASPGIPTPEALDSIASDDYASHDSSSGHDTHHPAARRGSAPPRRKTTREDMENWMAQSGMGRGTRADALGDPEEEEESETSGSEAESQLAQVEAAEQQDRSLRGSVY